MGTLCSYMKEVIQMIKSVPVVKKYIMLGSDFS